MNSFYYGVLEDVEGFKFTKSLSYFASSFDIFDKNTTEQQQSELKDFLFHSRWKRNVVDFTFFLLNISETIFIALLRFISGFCIGCYVCELMRPKATIKDEVEQFFLSYDKKYWFAIKSAPKYEHRWRVLYWKRFEQRKRVFKKIRKRNQRIVF